MSDDWIGAARCSKVYVFPPLPIKRSKPSSSVIVGSTSVALGALTDFYSSIFLASYASISSILLPTPFPHVVMLNAIILSSCCLEAFWFMSSAKVPPYFSGRAKGATGYGEPSRSGNSLVTL